MVSFDAHSGHNCASIFMKPSPLIVMKGEKSSYLELLYSECNFWLIWSRSWVTPVVSGGVMKSLMFLSLRNANTSLSNGHQIRQQQVI